MTVTARLQPLVQIPDVVLQFLPVLFLRDAIYADRRIFTQCVIRTCQRRFINEARLPPKLCLRVSLCSLHYLQKSR